MKKYNRIIISAENSFISKFVRNYLENNSVDKPEHVIRYGEETDEFPELLVIANPDCSMDEFKTILSSRKAKRVVMLSSTAIYGDITGENLNELTPMDENSTHYKAENAATELCRLHDMELTVLRLPQLIVGTGMGGMLIRIISQINRGTYLHIKDSSARRSVIHAASIGQAVADSVPGIYNIADPVAPEVRDLAEAIAFRTGQKRIYTVSLRKAIIMSKLAGLTGIGGWGKDMLAFKTESLTFSTAKAESAFGFSVPSTATDYLRNHIYDENSL